MTLRTYAFLLLALGGFAVGCGNDDDPQPPFRPDSGSSAQSEKDAGGRDAAAPSDASGPSDAQTPDASAAAAADAGVDANLNRDATAPAPSDSSVSPGPDASSVPDSGVSNDAATGSDAALPTLAQSSACRACEMTSCVDVDGLIYAQGTDLTKVCSQLTGNATEGRKAGTPKKDLCTALDTCARSTGCAKTNYLACLCGDMTYEECSAKAADESVLELPGVCKDEVLAAVETLIAHEVFERLKAPTYSSTVNALLECTSTYCSDECFAPCMGKADGSACGFNDAQVCTAGSCSDGSLGW